MTEDKLPVPVPDALNMDKATSAFKNLAERTPYKKLQKVLADQRGTFKGNIRPGIVERMERDRERAALEREREVSRLRAEESECERLARESDQRGDFKRYLRFWNRLNAARQGLIKLGAV